jgi:hypothetical protein
MDKKSKVVSKLISEKPQTTNSTSLPSDEIQRLTSFFSLLIKIDQRIKKGGKAKQLL